MGDLPCRIAQAHTAAEQTRKWDEGNNGDSRARKDTRETEKF